MIQARVLVLRAPGTNCDGEAAFAFEQAGGRAELLHVGRLLESPRLLSSFQILCLPGGFSYGDDIAAGRILGAQLRQHLGDALHEFRAAGKLILGICNGFQVMIKSGLFLDVESSDGPIATLTWNKSGKFEDRWVRLRTTGSTCVFLQGIRTMYLPVAHAEGQFVTRDPKALAKLDERGQLVLRYAASDATRQVAYPENPNGSLADVAGICDPSGRVLGLMPHPERHIDFTQHPHWTRRDRSAPPPAGDGLKVFQNAVGYFS